MKLLRSAKRDLNKDKDREHVSKLESVKVVLVYCNLVKTVSNKCLKRYSHLHSKSNLDN